MPFLPPNQQRQSTEGKLNTKSDDMSRSHLGVNIIQTSRNCYSVCCICLFLRGKRRTAVNDEWALCIHPICLKLSDSDNMQIHTSLLDLLLCPHWEHSHMMSMSVFVSLSVYVVSVCQRACLQNFMSSLLPNCLCVHVTYGHGSVLLLQHCHTLSISFLWMMSCLHIMA